MSAAGREAVNTICGAFPGAEKSDPWGGGHDAWKVGGKMFACIGAMGDGVSVKCADIEMASVLIESGSARRAPYFHKSWVRLDWDTPQDDMRHRLGQSYDLVRSKLTKKLQASLPEREV
ncbi:MAG: MmcQ/YjbR family DNA-binding protein [Pseudomonadota bacterium]